MKRRNLLKTLLLAPFAAKALKEVPVEKVVIPPPPSIYTMESRLPTTNCIVQWPRVEFPGKDDR